MLLVFQIGLADSADFSRILDRLGLGRPYESPELNFFNFFNDRYPIVSDQLFPIDITQAFVSISLFFNKVLFSKKVFSMFFLSVIYISLYSLGFFFLIRNASFYFENRKSEVGFILLSVILLSDVMFISYFNSFYQESAFILAGLYVFAFAFRRKLNYNYLVIALLILSVSKIQNLIFVFLPIGVVIFKWREINKIVLFIMIFLVVIITSVQLKTQTKTNEANIYEAVFLGVLLEADQERQKQVLSDFDLHDPSYLKNVGQGYWRTGNELYEADLNEEFYSKLNNWSIIKMYLMNPDLFLKTGYAGIKNLLNNSAQSTHLGNLTIQNSSKRQKTVVKGILGQVLHLLFIPIYIIALFYYLYLPNTLKMYRENRLIVGKLLIIPLIFCANFVSGGINDFVKHNLSFYLMFCFLIIALYISASRLLESRRIN